METAPPDLALEYQVTENDFVKAYLAHLRNGLAKIFVYYLLVILGVASILLGAVIAGLDWSGSAVFVFVGAAWIILGFALHPIRRWRLRRAYRGDPRFKTPIKITIEGNEWKVSTATAEAHYKEGTFIKAIETDSMFLFYHSPLLFNFIPKRDLTPDQKIQVNAFLDRVLPIRKGRQRFPASA